MKTYNPYILDSEIQNYINDNLNTDLTKIILKKSPFSEVTSQEIAEQIKGKKVAQKKFPFLLKEGIIFPPHLNLEQASSQSTADYKSKNLKGESFIDLTSGFGIDAYFLSQNFQNVTLIEQNEDLLKIVENNWNTLGKKANFVNANLEDFLLKNQQQFDVIYLDPARRDQNLKKKFLLEDLSPNLLDIQDHLLKYGARIIIKLSPLIDISYLVSVLKNAETIEIIAVKNEVKELIVILNPKSNAANIQCSCINLESTDPTFSFNLTEEKDCFASFSDPLNFLYIPNNAILKSGAFNLISKQFKIKKLHANSHFYTSEALIPHFPGRTLAIETIDAKQLEKNSKYNIIAKNYPLTPDEIKKKYKLKDGGVQYLIFTESKKGKVIIRSL